MGNLSEIVSEIKENRPIAEIELEAVGPKVRIGMEGRKRAAQTRLAELQQSYSDTIWQNAVLVVPVNYSSKAVLDQYCTFADEIGEFMPVNYQYWDEDVGNIWWDANGKKGQNIDTVHTIQLLDAVRKTMETLKLTELETPSVPRQVFLGTQQDCVDLVTKVTTDSCGVGFRIALLKAETARVAEQYEWAGGDTQPVPFVVLNATDSDLNMLSKLSIKPFYKVDLAGVSEVTEEFVKKSLDKVVKAHKKSSK